MHAVDAENTQEAATPSSKRTGPMREPLSEISSHPPQAAQTPAQPQAPLHQGWGSEDSHTENVAPSNSAIHEGASTPLKVLQLPVPAATSFTPELHSRWAHWQELHDHLKGFRSFAGSVDVFLLGHGFQTWIL